AACSPTAPSTATWPSSGKRWTICGCSPTRPSSRCTTASEPGSGTSTARKSPGSLSNRGFFSHSCCQNPGLIARPFRAQARLPVMIRPTETLRHRTARRRCGAFTATLLTAGMLAVTAAAGAAETRIYRTVDEDGNVVFTDVPPKSEQPGQSVDLNESNTFTAPERAGTGRSVESWLGGAEEDQEQEPADTGYRSLSITSPPPNAPLRDNA